jgi:hypothetical protein
MVHKMQQRPQRMREQHVALEAAGVEIAIDLVLAPLSPRRAGKVWRRSG